MSEYKALRDRIKKADSIDYLNRIDRLSTKLYNLGLLSLKDYLKVDTAIVDKKIEIDPECRHITKNFSGK